MAVYDIIEQASAAHDRDPRRYPFGYLTGGTGQFEDVRVFVWFRNLDDMIASLLEVEPRMYGVEPGRGLEAYQARVRPILEEIRERGFDDELRRRFAPEHDGRFAIYWWGSYYDLRDGNGVLGCQLVDEFLGDERRGQLLASVDESAFIRFLKPAVAG
ncbi:MAG: hypothetical protein U1F09_09870 [Steroidobacteraceae bacterium]